MLTTRDKNHLAITPLPTDQTKRIPIGKMSNSKAPPLGTGACHSLKSGKQMAGLPPMEMLSTPQLVARLLQMKTHKCTHTPSSWPSSSHSHYPSAQSSNLRVQSQGRGGRAGTDGSQGKSSSHPTLLGPDGFEQAMLFWGSGREA